MIKCDGYFMTYPCEKEAGHEGKCNAILFNPETETVFSYEKADGSIGIRTVPKVKQKN